MTFCPLDSALLGPLFTTADRAAYFSDEACLAAMVEKEAIIVEFQRPILLPFDDGVGHAAILYTFCPAGPP